MPLYPSCEFPLLGDVEAIDRVTTAIGSGQPFSLIRINDGEAVALGFDEDMSLADLAYLHGHWGAEGVPLGAVSEVKRDLEIAVQGADMVGVRDDMIDVSLPGDLLTRPGAEVKEEIVKAFDLRQHEGDNLSGIGARRLALLHRYLAQVEWSDDQAFCSVWIHWELLASGALTNILEEATEVGLVTSKPELEYLVERRFDVRTKMVGVPDKYVDANTSGAHVPRRYRTIKSDLKFPEGSLVLVGAGIPGKVYCQWLKEMGCVAIDVGSVFDAWIGKASRPRILESRFGVEAGSRVPDELQIRVPSGPQGRRLSPRWKPSEAPR